MFTILWYKNTCSGNEKWKLSHGEKAQSGTPADCLISPDSFCWTLKVPDLTMLFVGFCCYLSFYLEASPEVTLYCLGLSVWGIPAGCLKSVSPVNFCCLSTWLDNVAICLSLAIYSFTLTCHTIKLTHSKSFYGYFRSFSRLPRHASLCLLIPIVPISPTSILTSFRKISLIIPARYIVVYLLPVTLYLRPCL